MTQIENIVCNSQLLHLSCMKEDVLKSCYSTTGRIVDYVSLFCGHVYVCIKM